MLIAPQIVSHWFLGKELGVAMGTWNTAYPLGALLSFAAMGSVGQAFGWRGPILVSTGIALISMVAFLSLAEPAPLAQEGIGPRSSVRSAMLQAGIPIWLVGTAWLFFNASSLSFATFAPDYFQSQGYTVGAAGLLTSMTLWGTFLVAPLVGHLLDRGLRPEAFIAIGSGALALGLILISTFPSLVVPMLLLATVVNSSIVVSIFSLPPALLPPTLLGLSYGVLATCMNLGQALGPLAVGLARDLSGGYTASFWAISIMALFVGASIIPLLALRKAAE